MITNYLKAGFPALCILSFEPERAEKMLASENGAWRFLAWDCLRGIHDARTGKVLSEETDPVQALLHLDTQRETVLLAHNLHLFLESPEVVQAVQSGARRWKALGSCLVMLAPAVRLPQELEKVFTVLDLPLPGECELHAMQAELGGSVGQTADLLSCLAARGLTESEAENAFALSLVEQGRFSAKVIGQLKGQMLRKTGLLEFWEPADIGDVGGLGGLKDFIANRMETLTSAPADLPRLKSLLLVGIPGCGKSLSCKAVASRLGWPLIRLDIGSLKSSLVGESEARMRQATRVIDAFGQAVVWVDEIEKGFAGTRGSGASDGGTSAGMFSHWLTWMQETHAPVLIMATANDVSSMPPEFLRAGRWDAVFFVDLPNREERADIIHIMNRRYGSGIPAEYADVLDGFSGAEIEQLAKDSLFDGLDATLASTVPLSRTMKEEVSALRTWARNRARYANQATPAEADVRRVITQ